MKIIDLAIEPAYLLLPDRMRSKEATAMLLAIGLQESRFEHRRQIRGPARGFWQFERGGGVAGVLSHPASRVHASNALAALHYPAAPAVIHEALADNDVLAAVFARLLLFTDARPLPALTALSDESWDYYIRNWRPGKPHRQTWDAFWSEGAANARA